MNNSNINIKKPHRIRWYEFRKRTTPALFPLAYYFRPFTLSSRGRGSFRAVAQVSFDHSDRQTLIEERSFLSAQHRLLSALKRNPSLMFQQRIKSKILASRWIDWCHKSLQPQKLKILTNEQLIRSYNKYQYYYEKFSKENIYYWLVAADEFLDFCRQQISFIRRDKHNHCFEILTTPLEQSYLLKERLAFASLALKAKKRNPSWLTKALTQHSYHYGWVAWDYAGPLFWTVRRLRRRLSKFTPAISKDILYNERNYRTQLRRKQRSLEEKLSSRVKIFFRAAREQAMLQDEKKAVTTESHYYLSFLHCETGRRLKVRKKNLYFISFEEIADALRRKRPLPNGIRRSAAGVIIIQKGKMEIADGVLARRWRSVLSSKTFLWKNLLQGMTASCGHAIGRAAVVMTRSDIKNVKSGSILITQMTTPEYIQAMERASAFVTDEGGLTCHVAIVAREMKKPCVIGTKIATRVFKDGDRVEVDADRGVVRRIK